MKAFLIVVVVFGLVAAALFAPVGGQSFWSRAQEHGIPAALARTTARGLRAGWEFLASIGQPEDAAHKPARHDAPQKTPPKKQVARKAQAAAAPPHRATREGIVVQPVKERLDESDRVALDALVRAR